MTDVAGLIVEIKGNISQLEKALADAEGKVKGFSKKADSTLATIGKSLLASGAIYSVTSVLSAAADKIDNIGAKANNLGISAKGFQQLEYAAKRTDVSIASVTSSLDIFRRNLGLAIEGNEKASKAFESLGLDINKLKGMGLDDAFLETSSAISKVDNSFQQVSKAAALFGRGAAQNLNLVRADLKGLADEFDSLGGGLTEEDMQTWEKLDKTIDQLQTKIGIGLMNAVLALAPAAEAFFNVLSKTLGILPAIGSGIADAAIALHEDPDSLMARKKKNALFQAGAQNKINQNDIDFFRTQGIVVPKAKMESEIPNFRENALVETVIDASDKIKDQATAIADAMKDGASVIREGLSAFDNSFSRSFDAQKKALTSSTVGRIMKLVPGEKEPVVDDQFDNMVAGLIGDLRKGADPNGTGVRMQLGFIEDRAKLNSQGNLNTEGQFGAIEELKKFIQSMGGTGQKVDVNVTIADMTESFYIKWSTNQTVNKHLDKKFEDNLAQAAKMAVN